MTDTSATKPEPPQHGGAQTTKSAIVEGLRYAQIGLVLPCSVIAGWFLGGLADKWLGTHWINLFGLGFGIIAGFFDIIRTMKKMGKEV